MKSAYLLAGIQFKIFFQLVRNNKVSLWPKYIFRFLFVLQNSVWAPYLHGVKNKSMESR